MTELQWKPVVFLPVNLTVRFDAPVLTGDDPAGMVPVEGKRRAWRGR